MPISVRESNLGPAGGPESNQLAFLVWLPLEKAHAAPAHGEP